MEWPTENSLWLQLGYDALQIGDAVLQDATHAFELAANIECSFSHSRIQGVGVGVIPLTVISNNSSLPHNSGL